MAHRLTQDASTPARTPFAPQSTTAAPAATAANPSQAATASGSVTMPPELEQTLAMLTSHRSVLGYLLITRGPQPQMIRHSGIVFDGDQGKRYAAVISRIVETVHAGLEEIQGDDGLGDAADDSDQDEVRFMRIRTKRHEIMVSPDDRYLLAVLHDPAT